MRRNASGGIFVNKEELKQAFDFFDTGRKGYINMQDLRTLGAFNEELVRDVKFLLNNKKNLSFDELYQMLSLNTINPKEFNPVEMAFKSFEDGSKQNVMDIEKLKTALLKLGLENITEDDINAIKKVSGVEKDEEFRYEHFRDMLKLDPSLAKEFENLKLDQSLTKAPENNETKNVKKNTVKNTSSKKN
eukprot:jgi/Bigna1/135106/aug1.28_g9814